MPRLYLKQSKQFAGALPASGNIAVFSSLAAAAPAFSDDPDVIQSLPGWGQGWQGTTVGNKSPAMQDMVAAQYVFSYLLTQAQQRGGILEWSAAQDYYTDSVTTRNGLIYISIFGDPAGNTAANIGHDPAAPDGANYWTPINMRRSGPTALRPQNPPQGFVYLDTTIWQELIWANGAWTTTFGGPGMVIDVDAPDLATALTYYPGWQFYTPGVQRVIAGANPALPSQYGPGTQAGQETAAITANMIPAHYHYLSSDGGAVAQPGYFKNGTVLLGKVDRGSGQALTFKGAANIETTTDIGDARTGTTGGNASGQPDDLSLLQPTLYLFKLIKTIPGTAAVLR